MFCYSSFGWYFVSFINFQPATYISHLLGHEGPGSILSALKARGWSSSLVAGTKPTPRGFGFFGVAVDLTEDGMKHIDDIVKLVFQVSKPFCFKKNWN